MKTLVIVDDEPSVLNGLTRYVNWPSLGIELAGTANDGDTGLTLILERKPDIVLTDVKMPKLDGTEMAVRLRSLLPSAKIVFISGHNDTDYLKSALQVQAIDYIFKPISRKELTEVLQKVVAELDAEQRERELVGEMQVKLTQSMPFLREKFLLSAVSDGIHTAHPEEKLDFLELSFLRAERYLVLVVLLDDLAETMEPRSERDKQLLSYAVLNIIQELIHRTTSGIAFEKTLGEYVAILTVRGEDGEGDDEESAASTENGLLSLAEAIRDNLGRWLKLSVTIGVGEETGRLDDLPLSYKQAREAASQKWYLGKNRILTVDSMEVADSSRFRLEADTEEAVLSLLRGGDAEGLQALLAGIFERLVYNRSPGFAYERNAALHLVLLSGRVLLEGNLLSADWENRELAVWERALKQETLQDLKLLIETYLLEVCAAVGQKRRGRTGNVIERIERLIGERFRENLTAADIAAGVYLSPTYVSLLFKQETGETLFEYLTKVRVERAKELLLDPQTKFYEVCEAVGYSDPSHFSKVFKKMTGLTPSAFRDRQM
ncbi:response regulator [Cohnella nanjingensis]|uniref:Response regulator n=1 Tax=Cohnella nanjingensis TaxID=1387779 RepID=A0A7X0RTJ9_9BACL|nr:response regulator [Cohnella nanjingensis]MBB6673457.1 response regulator [Cohnella nanjingensis]